MIILGSLTSETLSFYNSRIFYDDLALSKLWRTSYPWSLRVKKTCLDRFYSLCQGVSSLRVAGSTAKAMTDLASIR